MLQGIINGVLDLSSIELGKHPFNPKPVGMIKVLAQPATADFVAGLEVRGSGYFSAVGRWNFTKARSTWPAVPVRVRW
jgi:hypothetical protein